MTRIRFVSPLDDRSFDELEDEVDRLAAEGPSGGKRRSAPSRRGRHFDPVGDENDFEELVRSAIDELPEDVLSQLGQVAIIVSDRGVENHAYGYYRGVTIGERRAAWTGGAPPEEILIFRDTLVRDFGHNQALLREEVRRTVRHEVGHYLGFDEAGVRRLGL